MMEMIIRTIKNKSGASLLFVLACAFLLLAIGISVLVAAGAGRGAMNRQAIHNQALLLEDSVHNLIRHSLQNVTDNDSLGAQIVWALYNADEGSAEPELDTPIVRDKIRDIRLHNIAFGSGLNIRDENAPAWVTDIIISFTDQNVKTSPSVPNDAFFDPVADEWVFIKDYRTPKTSNIYATIVVTVFIQTRIGAQQGKAPVPSVAEYEMVEKMEEGELVPVITDDTNPPHICPAPLFCLNTATGEFEHGVDFEIRMIYENISWELIKRGSMIGRMPE